MRQLGCSVPAFLNVQPRSLTNPDFTETLSDSVRTAGLTEDNVVLELTEQQTIVNPRAFAATLASLRERGFRIALDDYGEGSSNLNLFQDLRPDYLKISGLFCRGLAHDPFKQIIVRSTAETAGMGTIPSWRCHDRRLDTLVLAMPVSWKGTLVQYTGRLHRLHPRKSEVRIFD